MIKLYQFQFSHYCEKARWALDYKAVTHTSRNLLPGLHVKVAQKLVPETFLQGLPIIVDNGKVVQGSTEIITYLDEKFAERLLMPQDFDQAKEALDWEEYLDEEIGVTLRLWFYYHALPDRKRALRFMLDGAPWYGRPLLTVMFPKIRSVMVEAMNINAETARQSEARLEAALTRLDEALTNRWYLVGDRFSRADLTACALLSPFCLPDDAAASASFPKSVLALRDKHKTRRYFSWVREMYSEHRHPSRADAKVAA